MGSGGWGWAGGVGEREGMIGGGGGEKRWGVRGGRGERVVGGGRKV